MNLYTRTGDDGTTGLFGGPRVGKDHPRIEACGSIDELNAALGFALVECSNQTDLREILTGLQSRLFDLGADLATPHGSKHESKITRISADDVQQAEQWIDEIDAGNAPLKTFILPGGSESAARLHLARAICRRAERAVIRLRNTELINDEALKYLNRVSDLLFAMARAANRASNVPDVPWHPNK